MSTPDPQERTSVWPLVAVVGAFLVCCAGPSLIAILATTSLGVALAHRGASVVSAAGLIVAVVVMGIMWQRRRTCRCSVSAAPPAVGNADSHEIGGGNAPSRRRFTRVP
jgi:hypothetical protein